MRDELTAYGAALQVQAIAAILLALGKAPLNEGDPHAALTWLGFQLDEAGAILVEGSKA